MEKEKRQYTKKSKNGGNYRNSSRDDSRRHYSDREDVSSASDMPVSENIIIGRNAVRELLKSGASVDKVLVSGREGSIVALIAEAKKANAFVLSDNKQTPKAPNLPEYQQDSMDEFFEDVKFLASFIGCNIFEVSQPKTEHIFYTKGRGCDAKGFYSSNGFTVLKGSVIAKTAVPSLKWSDKRNSLVNEYTTIEFDKLVMTSDKTFASPSTAADFCIGSSNNGWIVWKDKDGNTLDSVYRKQLEL